MSCGVDQSRGGAVLTVSKCGPISLGTIRFLAGCQWSDLGHGPFPYQQSALLSLTLTSKRSNFVL